MACKIKRTPTNAERERLRQGNEQQAKKMKVGRMKKVGKTKQEKEKEDGAVKRMKRGLKALHEIKWYQSNTNLLIWRLPFQRVVREVAQSIRADLQFQSTAIMAFQEAGEAFLMDCWNKQTIVPYMPSV